MVKAFEEHKRHTEYWKGAETVAAGLRVPSAFAGRLILDALYESEGTAVAVTDEAILQAQQEVAGLEGVFAAPEGAATYAALKQLREIGWLSEDARVVLYNTGSGLKYI